MWHVVLENRDLDGCRSNIMIRLHGPHLVCLTHDQMILIQANSNGGRDSTKDDPLEIAITSIRVCGHTKEGMFFIEPGRASGIGSGRLWMDLGDEVMAASMHKTFLSLMYDLNHEEDPYRNRSYSSGSNSSRARTVRSHHNNPPPSLIGMGKVIHPFSSKRIRCDSMPAPHVAGLNDSRMRTGSEGEHTLRRPTRGNSTRSHSGSSSPGMRSRLLRLHGRRSSFVFRSHLHHHHHVAHVSHNYTWSYSEGGNLSSTESSSEQLNNLVGMGDFSALLPYDGASADDFLDHGQNVLPCSQRSNSICRRSKHHQGNWTPPIQESSECRCRCGSHCQTQVSRLPPHNDGNGLIQLHPELVPPPPDIEPPQNPNKLSAHSAVQEYNNYSSYFRTQSFDETTVCSTDISSLSSSPRQTQSKHEEYGIPGERTSVHDSEEHLAPTSQSASPKQQSPICASSESPLSQDDYTLMNYNGPPRYPHQSIPATKPKNSSSILSKVASFTGLSPSSKIQATDQEYANVSASSSDFKTSSCHSRDGYVPMRCFSVRSMPRDINSRRRSMPDTSYRGGFSRNHRASPPTNESLTHAIGQGCHDCAAMQKRPCNKAHSYSSQSSLNKSSTCQNCLDETKGEVPVKKDALQSHLSPPSNDSRISTPSPTSKCQDNAFNLHALNREVQEIDKTIHNSKCDLSDGNLSTVSSPSDSGNDVGYLPMNPAYPGMNGFVRKILSVAESQASPSTALYPHQRTAATLDRPNKSRSKKPKSLSFRHSGSFSRRSTLLKQKSSNDLSDAIGFPLNSSSRSAGGDYVNIDFKKAQEQLHCPYVLNLSPSKSTNNCLKCDA